MNEEQGVDPVEQQIVDSQSVSEPQSPEVESILEEASSDEAVLVEMSTTEKIALLEALLLAYGDALPLPKLQEILNVSKQDLLHVVDGLQDLCAGEDRGIEVVVVGEKLQLRTKGRFADQIQKVMAVKPRKLSQAALETLSVVAYRQPIVKSEIDKIRGVDVAPTLKTLSERKLIKILGYQASVGQPALYGTTEDFLQIFGLHSLSALPAIQDLKVLAQEPGEAQSEDVEDISSEQEEEHVHLDSTDQTSIDTPVEG